MLQRFEQYRFVQYSSELTDGEVGNVGLRRANLHGFRADLCRAAAVICNAGFELVGECLHMGIPTLVKPVQGQMEQQSNAFALEQLGWGTATQTLDENIVRTWLEGERRITPIVYPDVASELVDWVLEGDWQDKTSLWSALWEDSSTHQKLPRIKNYAAV
jgi:uncharacterized protein (TIGR00661 family)